jgi:hypothetical protein
MPTNINFGKKLGISAGTNIILPSVSPVPSFADTKSFQLDGNIDFVTYADNSNLSFGDGVTDSPFSISAWIKVTTGTAFIIVGKYLAYPNGEYKFVKQADGTVLIRIISGNNELSRRGRTTNSIDSLVGQWVHVVSTYNGNSDYSGLKIYIDGVRSDVANNGKNVYTAMSNTTYPLNIGKFANTNVNEVSIFNSELSQSEVLSIFNGGLPDSLTAFNPLLWLRMGEEATWNGGKFVLDNQGSIGGTATSVGITPTDPNPTSDVPLFDNKSFIYDGSLDLVSMGNVLTMASDGTDSFSVSLWFKTTSTQQYQQLMGKQNKGGSYEGWAFQVFAAAHQSQFRGFLGTVAGNARITFQTSYNADVRSGNWNHVVMTYDGSQSASGFKVYLNNSPLTVTAILNNTPADISNATDFLIGQRGTSSNYDLAVDGSINDASYFNSKLIQEQVTEIYNGGVANDISSLNPLGYWRAEEVTFDGSNWIMIDQGSGANNGTSQSMPLTSRTSDVPT